jgi:hypothetical protein
MSIFERIGVTLLTLTILLLFSLTGYAAFDYYTYIRPQAIKLTEVIMKDASGKEYTRIDVYDAIVAQVVNQQKKESN